MILYYNSFLFFFSQDGIPNERVLNFVYLGDQDHGPSLLQGPRKWKSFFTFEKLPHVNGNVNGQIYDFNGMLHRDHGGNYHPTYHPFELQVSNDGSFQNIKKPGSLYTWTQDWRVQNFSNFPKYVFNLFTDPGHEKRSYILKTSRAMAYQGFVHPLGKSRAGER